MLASGTINFATARAEIDAGSATLLDRLADVARGCEGVRIAVGGHTDSTGEEVANVALSQARAEAVMTHLVSEGFPGEAVTAKGYGSAAPIADNATRDGRARNRRIELKVSAPESL